MKHHESQQLVLKIISIGFFLAFLFNLAPFIFPADMSTNPPHYPRALLIMQSLSVAFTIFASTLLGLKLTEDRQTLPAAGFTMYAIANGVAIVIFFEMRQFTTEEYEKIYDIYTSSIALLLPATLLLLFFADVPKWLRWCPSASSFFYALPIVMYYAGYRQFNIMDEISFVGYIIMTIVYLLWSVYIWKMIAGSTVPE